jgi:hypothetical protein
MDEQILNRIKESRREYDKKTQRAELLIRNKQFIKELKETPADFVVDFEDRLKFKTKKLSVDGVNLYINVESFSKFKNFCLKWHIHSPWDGNIDTLSEFIKCGVSAKFGQMRAFPKLQIICDNLKLGEMQCM